MRRPSWQKCRISYHKAAPCKVEELKGKKGIAGRSTTSIGGSKRPFPGSGDKKEKGIWRKEAGEPGPRGGGVGCRP